MTDINLEKLNSLLLRCVKIVSATRRLCRDCGVELRGVWDLERELRDSQKEVWQRMKEVVVDENRPLIEGVSDGGCPVSGG